MKTTLDYAFDALRLGLKVLPLNGKEPAKDKHGKHIGITRATFDPATVREWFRVDGVHNIGGVVPSWFAGFDVDPRHGGLESWERLLAEAGIEPPSTYTTRSGRNDGGFHAWFRKHEGFRLSAKHYPGIDLKDGSGYLVMPGSIHPETGLPYTVQNGGAIIALPDEFYPFLEVKPVVPQAFVSREPYSTQGRNFLAEWVSRSLNGERNKNVFWALCEALRQGYEQHTIDEIMRAGVALGLPPEEVAASYRSALMREGRK
jgi:hypothetical protein